jgi:hypothetical protein
MKFKCKKQPVFDKQGRMQYYEVVSPEYGKNRMVVINAESEQCALARARKVHGLKNPKIKGHSSYGIPGF